MEVVLYILVGMAIMLTLAFIYFSLQLSSECSVDEELMNFIKQREEVLEMSYEDLNNLRWEQESVIENLENKFEEQYELNKKHQEFNGQLQKRLTDLEQFIINNYSIDEMDKDGRLRRLLMISRGE